MAINQQSISNGVMTAAKAALLLGGGAWGMNQIGLAKKVMGHAAPNFMDAAKYGLARGTVTFAVAIFSTYVNSHLPKDSQLAKGAINIGALAFFYFSVPYVASFTKNHLNANVNSRFIHLALIVEGMNFCYDRM